MTMIMNILVEFDNNLKYREEINKFYALSNKIDILRNDEKNSLIIEILKEQKDLLKKELNNIVAGDKYIKITFGVSSDIKSSFH